MHRALANPVRQRLVSLLRAADGPRDVQDLATELGLHANTVRTHLAVLEEAALVASEPEERDRPGRPRLVYRATPQAAERTEAPGYRFLAEILTSYLAATLEDPAGAAEEAGAGWGRYAVDRPAPFQSLTPADAVARIVDMLAELGFAPELDDHDPATPRVLLRRCPFLEVAKEHQEIVCSIHLGLMRGALDELGVEVVTRDLNPFVEPDLCVADLEVPA